MVFQTNESPTDPVSKGKEMSEAEAEAHNFSKLDTDASEHVTTPGSEEIDRSCEFGDLEEDEPPRGPKRTRSKCWTDGGHRPQALSFELAESDLGGIPPIDCKTEKPQVSGQILDDVANIPGTVRLSHSRFSSTSYYEVKDAVAEGSEAEATLPRTQSAEDIQNIANERFLSIHVPAPDPQKAAQSHSCQQVSEVQESDIVSAEIQRRNKELSMPKIDVDGELHLYRRFQEEYLARVKRDAERPSRESVLRQWGFCTRMPTDLGDTVLDEFVKRSIAKTHALLTEGTVAARAQAKEIKQIVEWVLMDEKKIDIPDWVLDMIFPELQRGRYVSNRDLL